MPGPDDLPTVCAPPALAAVRDALARCGRHDDAALAAHLCVAVDASDRVLPVRRAGRWVWGRRDLGVDPVGAVWLLARQRAGTRWLDPQAGPASWLWVAANGPGTVAVVGAALLCGRDLWGPDAARGEMLSAARAAVAATATAAGWADA